MLKIKKTALHTPPKKEVKQNYNTNDQSSTIPEKNKPLSNGEKKKTTSNHYLAKKKSG